jgi:hypothetical protein
MAKKDKETKKKSNQYSDVKRPNVTLTLEEHKKIAKFCIDNEIKIGDFLRRAGVYCVTNGIVPE